MPEMNYSTYKWDLRVDLCPCDIHFNEWIDDRRLRGRSIYHFGTGAHHVIGARQAENGSGNVVFGVTASIEEYDAYIRLVTDSARVSRSYLAYFGDVYLANPKLLPRFDVVTMFHLCEFPLPSTTSPEYGGLSDRGLLDLFTGKTRPGGHILFYTGSMAFGRAEPLIAAWAKDQPVERLGEFKTLLVYRKRRGRGSRPAAGGQLRHAGRVTSTS